MTSINQTRSLGLVIGVLCVALAMSGGCGRSKIKMDREENTVKGAGIELSVNWVKDKGKKFDIESQVLNTSDKSVIIMLNDFKCTRGGVTGMIKHTFFNTGERTIDFNPGEMKRFRMVCDLGSDTEGKFGLTIRRVFENPTGDGSTKGEIVAKDIVWEQEAKK